MKLSAAARRTAAAGLMLLTACATPALKDQTPGPGGPAPSAPPTVAPAQNGASAAAAVDWHRLVVAPFGTLLKDSPVRLHEVLFFHEEPPGPAEIESKDCYAVDGVPPTFAGSPADEYVMCFEHDRLDRIDASVRLAVDAAARDFEQACASWLKNATALPAADGACAGRDGDIAFSARLAFVPGEPSAELLMTLSAAAELDAERAPP